jgi:hypothetical protein
MPTYKASAPEDIPDDLNTITAISFLIPAIAGMRIFCEVHFAPWFCSNAAVTRSGNF